MKTMDKIAQRLFAGLFGTAAIIFAFAALIYSTNPATAAHPNTGYESGKYMMSMNSEWNDKTMSWYILVWNTETGQSKMYYGSGEINKITAASSSYQLPSSPL